MPNTETKWTLPTPDGKTIYGLKNAAGQGADKAIFIVHGLTGHMYEYQVKRAADYFADNGYDVYRFNLYDGWDNARSILNCTLQTHADDLTTVMDAYAKTYKQTFAIGHSFGGPTVMLANPANLTAASLWDPSFDMSDFYDDGIDLGDTFQLNWGAVYLLGKPMVEHAFKLDDAACTALAGEFYAPVQVIAAADGSNIKKPHNYHSFGRPGNLARNRQDVVKGTQHCFYEGQTCEDLLAKTHNWFKGF